MPRQHVSALGTVLADDEPPLRQTLQDLREQLGRNAEFFGDPLRADGAEAVVRGDVVNREYIVKARFYRRLFLSATLSVAFYTTPASRQPQKRSETAEKSSALGAGSAG
jgi:hypothetical protein